MPAVWIPPANQPVSTRIYFSVGKIHEIRHHSPPSSAVVQNAWSCITTISMLSCHSASLGTDKGIHYYRDFCDSSYIVLSQAVWTKKVNKMLNSMNTKYSHRCMDICTWEHHYSEKNQEHHQYHNVTHWEILHKMNILLVFLLYSAGLTSSDTVPWISALTAIVVLLLKLFVAGVL